MAIQSVWCHVIQASVTRVTDMEGTTLRVICPEYDKLTGACGRKLAARGGGPLSQFLERMAGESLDTRSVACPLG